MNKLVASLFLAALAVQISPSLSWTETVTCDDCYTEVLTVYSGPFVIKYPCKSDAPYCDSSITPIYAGSLAIFGKCVSYVPAKCAKLSSSHDTFAATEDKDPLQ